MLTELPAAENRLCPEAETSRSCTTVSELEVPLPEGGLEEGGRRREESELAVTGHQISCKLS